MPHVFVETFGPLGAALSVVATILSVLALFWLWLRLSEAGQEDARWRRALEQTRATFGEAREVIMWDTRILRPWGPSTAVEAFIELARRDGFDWLEDWVAPLQSKNPLGIRAILTSVDGLRVAYVHCYARRNGNSAGLLVETPLGVLRLKADPEAPGHPPEDLLDQVRAVAADARASAPT